MAAAQADAREIDDAVRVGANMAMADTGVDDGELEDELNALVKEVEEEKAAVQKAEAEDKVAALKAPSHSPASQTPREVEEQVKISERA